MHLFLTLTQLLASQDVNWCTGVVLITCGLLWCIYQLFGLSYWRHPFTAEDPLLSKLCNVTFLQIWWRLRYFLAGLRVSTFSAIFHFGLNYSFKTAYRVTFNLMLHSVSPVCVWMSWLTLDAKVCRWHRWHLVGRFPDAEGIDRTCVCVCVWGGGALSRLYI